MGDVLNSWNWNLLAARCKCQSLLVINKEKEYDGGKAAHGKELMVNSEPMTRMTDMKATRQVMKLDILHSCCLSNEMSFSHSRHFRIRIAMTTRSACCFYRCCAALFWTLKKQQCLFTASFFPPLYLRSPNVEVCWLYSVSYFIFYLWSAKMLAQEKEETLSNPIKGIFPVRVVVNVRLTWHLLFIKPFENQILKRLFFSLM